MDVPWTSSTGPDERHYSPPSVVTGPKFGATLSFPEVIYSVPRLTQGNTSRPDPFRITSHQKREIERVRDIDRVLRVGVPF